ncbi:MAG: sulfatase [Bacteroidia bacterium]|nr:sulfatase [Bacteroidia bacterium]
MNQLNLTILLALSYSYSANQPETSPEKTNSPNLLIIQTDEHNFRTLGCYRAQLSHEQAFMWGDGNYVETPNIDYLAKSGVIFTKFYAATPVCSPSRGSLVSGMYPQYTGAPVNDVPMNRNIVTFAEVLSKAGYQNGFIGKWHLDGEDKPGWEPVSKFGFEDNKYMYNRGHWKKLVESVDGPQVGSVNSNGDPIYDLNGADEKSFTTDFLTDRAIQFFKRNASVPFCLYLSYPDPHGPDLVRPPYDQMYTNLPYVAPANYYVNGENAPSWAKPEKNAGIDQSQYFGMVKCIDDNIGRLLKYLKSEKLIENTVIIFTSDHGDLRAEHHRENKGVPLEASAKVPLIISYPARIPSGAVVNKVFNTVDFAPTILSFLNQKAPAEMQGRNFADLLTNPVNQKDWEDITFMRSTGLGNTGNWVAAVTSRYKLILSKNDEPWLIDLQEDPYELINFISKPEMEPVVKELAKQLSNYAQKRNDPFLQGTKMAEDLKTIL